MISKLDELQRKLREKKVFSPTSKQERLWLIEAVGVAARKLPKGLIVECGTMNAKTAILMASAIRLEKGRHLDIAIETRIISVDSYMAHEKDSKLKSFAENVALIRELNYGDLLTLVEGDDIEFLQGLPDGSVSLLWIDSLHTQEHVSKTLNVGLSKMMPGGLVCGHDYRYHNRGLIYAVEDWRKEHAEELCGFATCQRIWWTIFRGDRE